MAMIMESWTAAGGERVILGTGDSPHGARRGTRGRSGATDTRGPGFRQPESGARGASGPRPARNPILQRRTEMLCCRPPRPGAQPPPPLQLRRCPMRWRTIVLVAAVLAAALAPAPGALPAPS